MRITISVALLLLAPATGGAQQARAQMDAAAAAPDSIARTSLPTTGEAAADARIVRALARLESAGIPNAALAERVQLGRARGVDALRIATAVERRAAAMLDARAALRTSAGTPASALLELSADAIESGAQASQVAAVAHAFPGRERSRALLMLASLAADGRIGLDAVASVRGALNAAIATREHASSDGEIGARWRASRAGAVAGAARWTRGGMRAVPH